MSGAWLHPASRRRKARAAAACLVACAATGASGFAAAAEAGGEPEDPPAIHATARFAGGEIAAGWKTFRPWIIRRDDRGETQWERTFPEREGGRFGVILPLGEGGVLAAGAADIQTGPAWAVGLDAGGRVLWEQNFGDESFAVAAVAALPRDGATLPDAVLAGGSSSGAASARWAARIDAGGRILWRRSFDGPGAWGAAAMVVALADGGVLVAGERGHGCLCEGVRLGEPWAARLRGDGATVWEKTFGADLGFPDAPAADAGFPLRAVDVAPDGGFILKGEAVRAGKSGAESSVTGLWSIGLDAAGAVMARAFQPARQGEAADPFRTPPSARSRHRSF